MSTTRVVSTPFRSVSVVRSVTPLRTLRDVSVVRAISPLRSLSVVRDLSPIRTFRTIRSVTPFVYPVTGVRLLTHGNRYLHSYTTPIDTSPIRSVYSAYTLPSTFRREYDRIASRTRPNPYRSYTESFLNSEYAKVSTVLTYVACRFSAVSTFNAFHLHPKWTPTLMTLLIIFIEIRR